MRITRVLPIVSLIAGVALVIAVSLAQPAAQAGAPVPIDADDIGGRVTGPRGPEAGVWVIAETRDLPTRFIKSVVTDDEGRYVIPDLPKASYQVFVRGYGLVDSARVTAAPGAQLNLTAVVAPNPRAAAQYYPASYWYSLAKVPEAREFPGTGPNGNGINENIKNQAQWLRLMKTDSCEACHQIGSLGTREIPAALGVFPTSVAAWERRIQSGQAGNAMVNGANNLGARRFYAMMADWTDRIKAGEVPPAPPRPQGQERNVVITQWDWADPKAYLHDEVATDKRNPSVNANGPLFGSLEQSHDYLPVLDPVRHTTDLVNVPVRDPNTSIASPMTGFQPSPHWGAEPIWDSKANVHNPMMDQRGRVWVTSRVRNNDTPAFCKAGSTHPSARVFPINQSGRQLAMYDPATKQMTLIDTCFATHHLFFAEDANNTLWTSSGGGGGAVGWLNTKLFDETKDEARSQGWTPLILDTNGNGRRDAFVEPNEPVDPTKDKRINAAFYGVMPSPDGSIWGSVLGFPGSVVRLVPGTDPTNTAIAEVFELPYGNPRADVQGFSPRGMDVDRNGVVWAVLSSGHLASFDRKLCRGTLNGPNATGQHCPEGWRFYQSPGPQFQGVTDPGSADSHYYNWVDQFDTFGMGRNTPIATGNGSDALLALNTNNGQWTVLRVPYPSGFFAKGMDGRIDDPRAGWKGKGLWSTWATRTPFHTEGGTSNQSKVVHFQLRPNTLAK
jgi:hypothetical protein